MALEKEVRSFTLTDGLNTKADPKVVPQPKLLILENGRFEKAGRISKRYGSEALGTNVVGSSSLLEDSDALGVFNDELLIFNKQSVYSYSENAARSSNKGGCVSASVSVLDITRNNYQQTQVDSAVLNNITLVAYEDQRGGIRYAVNDNDTGTALITDTELVAAGGSYAVYPHVFVFDGHFYVTWVTGGDLKGLKIDPTDPSNIGSPITITSAIKVAAPTYDIIPFDTFIAAALNLEAAPALRVLKLNKNLAIQASADIAEAATTSMCVVRGPQSTIFVNWHNASGVRTANFDVNLAQLNSETTVSSYPGIIRMTGYKLPDDSGIHLFYEIPGGVPSQQGTIQQKIYNDLSLGGESLFLISVGIASRAWAYSPDTTDKGFIGLVHQSTLQSTFFVARSDGMIVAKAQYGYAGGLLLRNIPATVSEISPGKFQFAVLSKGSVVSENRTGFVTLKGVSLINLDFSDFRNFTSAQLADNALIVGGVVQSYDSAGAVEHGFHLFPEDVTGVASNGAGALTSSKSYGYCVTYEWTDNKGQVHRSAPSIPITVTTGASDDTVTLTIPTLRLTQKKSPRSPVNIVVYRTVGDGTVYYQASSPTTLTFNNTGIDTITYTDLLADSSLISRQPLYITGGVLENIAPPSASLIAVYRNRIVLGGTEDDTVWLSKEVQKARPVEFNDTLIIKVDPIYGRLTGLATLDDKLLLFKENSIFFTGGDGPNDLGANGSFLTPESITVDVGCVDSKSIVTTPEGIMFKSRKGYYLIDRSLNAQYVGAEIEEFNDFAVTAAVLVADANEVRFCTEDGPVLVYNYFFQAWSIWPNYLADDAIVWKNQFTAIKNRINATALVVREVPGFFLDINQPYSLKISLAFAQFAQVQGFQRIWRVLLLGEYKSPHVLKVSLSYDFQPFTADEYYWDPVSRMNITEYGDGAYYGSDAVYGGSSDNSGVYQVRTHVPRQKCQALKIEIQDLNIEGSYEGYNISSVAFEMGIKKGIAKLASAQTQ